MTQQDYSAVFGSDPAYLDQLYQSYQSSPESLSEEWRAFFKGFDFAQAKGLLNEGSGDSSPNQTQSGFSTAQLEKEFKVFRLIQSYRARGHLLSKTNPIRERKNRQPYLELADFGLGPEQIKEKFSSGFYLGLGNNATLAEILDFLQKTYTGSLGIEYMHVTNTEIRRWFRERVEKTANNFQFSIEKKKRILQKLNEAAVFESFLDTKYVGQKRFSLEGGENTIPALDAILNKAAGLGVAEVVIGMAHRGRLNVLTNILGKTYDYVFNEFEGQARPDLSYGDGDVKYHLGYTSQVETFDGKKIQLKLMPNPSHLEAVGPVVLGFTRGQRDHLYKEDSSKVLPIILHGDAAVAGQGIVYESAQMSQLKGYKVGGAIHFVVNNQIGFTTDFDDARSSTYCTSVARVTDSPVIHVNGDDAEAVVYAVELAVEFRQTFQADVYIDMVCYRKHGHNESDEPRFTQPQMYEFIKNHLSPREIYIQKLVQGKTIEADLAQKMEQEFKALLQDRFNSVKQKPLPYLYQKPEQEWLELRKAKEEDFIISPPTGVKREKLEDIYQCLITIPQDLKPIVKAQKLLEDRKKKWNTGLVDWAMAELLSYGSLIQEGFNIRLSGQDCIRGTFSHRHSSIFDQDGKNSYNNLNYLKGFEGKFKVYNSLLSEYAVLAFDYGHSLTTPKSLVIWEAQFGDFANGAQTIFDQFISSGESKWQKMSGLVCLLPHGYEGQGPEHSNARPERFLQLCAENNLIVVNATTPANFYHLLRRQLKWHFRKPLVVMTPKSLLRHPDCQSKIEELEKGQFQEVIYEKPKSRDQIKRVILCTGKIYYDLNTYRVNNKREDILIVRLEQLHPFPEKQIRNLLNEFSGIPFYWVQEEPKNMGAWTYLLRFSECREFHLISRKASASPATGYASVHAEEQLLIVENAFKMS